jgi:hypothetical protein
MYVLRESLYDDDDDDDDDDEPNGMKHVEVE